MRTLIDFVSFVKATASLSTLGMCWISSNWLRLGHWWRTTVSCALMQRCHGVIAAIHTWHTALTRFAMTEMLLMVVEAVFLC
jgi:hypothetical protein